MDSFTGVGDSHALGRTLPPWVNSKGYQVVDEQAPGHPAGYQADAGLVEAVNTALILAKPLLLTGRPGTGKSELAERIAWELGIGPVLRFEAQSLTEAQELFHRFDLVGQMADAQLAPAQKRDPLPAEHFLTFGPIGKSILYANPGPYADLLEWDRRSDAATVTCPAAAASIASASAAGDAALGAQARRSVVLIDEIDKAARDVPNDLLNGIERMEFRIRDLRNRLVAAPDDLRLRPVVVITSNSERDLPEPFLRRCVFYHIPDPTQDKLREILRARVAGLAPRDSGTAGSSSQQAGGAQLAPFYEALLSFFVAFRDDPAAHTTYTPGTSELLDWSRVLQHLGAKPELDLEGNKALLDRTLSAVVKHGEDLNVLLDAFRRLRQIELRPLAA
jgi:MoxR-like ATPase